MRILFVCTGNTCRSPMAEALFREKAPGHEVQSAGIFAGNEAAANENTIEVLREQGINLQHKSQPVNDELLDWADLVLTMTTEHKQELLLRFPEAAPNVFTLKEYVRTGRDDHWEEIKQLTAEYELLKQQNGSEEKQRDIEKRVYQLQEGVADDNIADPFGRNIQVYRRTRDELTEYINRLIDKLEEEK